MLIGSTRQREAIVLLTDVCTNASTLESPENLLRVLSSFLNARAVSGAKFIFFTFSHPTNERKNSQLTEN
jgi:hypothetical protein